MLYPSLKEERKLWKEGYQSVAGVDEVGRGAWAGPIVAAAVIFHPYGKPLAGVRDSKQLTPKMRERLFPIIIKSVRAWGIGSVSAAVIDRIGIAEANRCAMRNALEQLSCSPDFVLTDYVPLSWRVLCRAVADGDGRVQSIAAASIVAKVWRDNLMCKAHERFSAYAFHRHKGYGTKFHEAAIRRYGLCVLHRRTFVPVRCLKR